MSTRFTSKLLEEAVNEFASLPGIGRKTAGRIVMELSGKIETVLQASRAPALATNEALDALLSLGYQRSVASRAVEDALVEIGPGAGVEETVKMALKMVSGKKRKA